MKEVEEICAQVSKEDGEVVVAANYNCPGQVVISGSIEGINKACELMKAAGAKKSFATESGRRFPFSADESGKNRTRSSHPSNGIPSA